jgi:hypothetical protein
VGKILLRWRQLLGELRSREVIAGAVSVYDLTGACPLLGDTDGRSPPKHGSDLDELRGDMARIGSDFRAAIDKYRHV